METQLEIPAQESRALAPIQDQAGFGNLLELAIREKSAIDVIERLVKLQQDAEARRAERQFNVALAQCQKEIPRIVPDLNNPNSKKKYSSYEALDKAIRPVYLAHNFSLSFGTADCPNPEKVRTVCRVSHEGGHSQTYQIDITADGSGPKGGGMLTRPHSDLAANTLGIRRLLRMIFNIVDTAEDEMLTNGWLLPKIQAIEQCKDEESLTATFNEAYKEAKTAKNGNALLALIEARDRQRNAIKSTASGVPLDWSKKKK